MQHTAIMPAPIRRHSWHERAHRGTPPETFEGEHLIVGGDIQQSRYCILQEQEVQKKMSPKHDALSQFHQAEVLFFLADSVSCMEHGVNIHASNKVDKLWSGYSMYSPMICRRFDGSKILFMFHVKLEVETTFIDTSKSGIHQLKNVM